MHQRIPRVYVDLW